MDLTIRANEIHVWRLPLDRTDAEASRLAAAISADEEERAARFVVATVRWRWTMARGLLRMILGRYLGVAPHQVRFRYGEQGKPSIDGGRRALDLRFNLSHSDNLALVAVARDREVGIDLEMIRPNRDVVGIATGFFSTREATTLRALPPAERIDAFYRCWTRKEAYIKATGAGLSIPLNSFDVACAPGEPAELLATRGAPHDFARWSMIALDPGPEYAAALVVEGSGWTLRPFDG